MFSKLPRFTEKPVTNTPGPGHYDAEAAMHALEPKSGIYLSVIDRFQEESVPEGGPEPTPVEEVHVVASVPPKPPRASIKPPRKSVKPATEVAREDPEDDEYRVTDTVEERERKRTMKRLKQEMTEMKTKFDMETANHTAKVASLKADLKYCEEDLKEQAAHYAASITELENSKEALQQEMAASQQRIAVLEAELVTLQQQLNQAEVDHARALEDARLQSEEAIALVEARCEQALTTAKEEHDIATRQANTVWKQEYDEMVARMNEEAVEAHKRAQAQLQQEVNNKYHEIKKLQQEFSTNLRAKTQYFEDKVSALEAEITQCKTQAQEQLQSSELRHDAIVASLREQHQQDIEQQCMTHKELLDAARDSCAAELCEMQAKLSQCEEQRLVVEEQLRDTSEELSVVRQQYSDALESTQEQQNQHRKALEALINDKQAVDEQLRTLSEELKQVQVSLERKCQEFVSARKEWDGDRTKMMELYDGRHKAVTDSMADLKARFKREMANKDATIDKIRSQLTSAEKQLGEVTSSFKASQETILELTNDKSSLEHSLKQSNDKIIKQHDDMMQLQQQIAAMTSAKIDLESALKHERETVESLEARLFQSENSLDIATKHGQSLESQVTSLQHQLNVVETAKDDICDELMQTQESLNDRKDQNATLTSQLQAALQEGEFLQGEAAKVTAQLEATRDELAISQQLCAAITVERDNVMRQLRAVEQEATVLVKRISEIEGVITTTTQQQTRCVEEVATLTEKLASAETERDGERELRQQVELELLSLQGQLEEQKATCTKELTSRIKELEDEVEHGKSEKDALVSLLNKIRAIGSLEDVLTAKQRAGELEAREVAALKQLEELAGETGRLAGHQNTKQKIHYVMDLKKENVDLKLKVAELTAKVAALSGGSVEKDSKRRQPLATNRTAVTTTTNSAAMKAKTTTTTTAAL